ncbi:uncharacterized protein SPAPADRAFT_59136 [Spathaspora passalidarum NRRL Y-27907]|uniref:Cyclin-D1-binding protein 1-like N-terminal domain-containing protein n=1 Tax=Spathaspora passalidarum (strain NRRL Y-27907 / 11-Y1) TaxID=619300 RepID=G3AIW6_SPAPN|nr:uncharacterized protein SPAPADRAFT_59136 [Spathaspora passalidarum NRRL Y-27907]EGW33777.1 hypothetical protein SPAPADRAFT_59136 [Spathaspora passalidarum NRRL Y-27907]
MPKTREDLTSLIDSFEEATQYWISTISDPASISKIQAAQVPDPINELLKSIKLLKAHTTKTGIIFKPENLKKELDTAFNTLSKLSETLILTISIISQLDVSSISKLFHNEIINQVKQLLESNHMFSKELKLIFEDIDNDVEKELKKDEMDGRLLAVAKIWSNCDSLVKLIENGSLSLLTDKIKQSILLLEDGFEDFEEWAENPEEIDDDPFGFSDDEDEENSEEPPADNEDEEESVEVDREELITYAKKWLKKIELIKLLIASFKKSLPKTTPGESIDTIYAMQTRLVSLVDKFIVDLMLDRTIDKEIESYTTSLNKESIKLAHIARDLHKDKKASWYQTWETKYNSI